MRSPPPTRTPIHHPGHGPGFRRSAALRFEMSSSSANATVQHRHPAGKHASGGEVSRHPRQPGAPLQRLEVLTMFCNCKLIGTLVPAGTSRPNSDPPQRWFSSADGSSRSSAEISSPLHRRDAAGLGVQLHEAAIPGGCRQCCSRKGYPGYGWPRTSALRPEQRRWLLTADQRCRVRSDQSANAASEPAPAEPSTHRGTAMHHQCQALEHGSPQAICLVSPALQKHAADEPQVAAEAPPATRLMLASSRSAPVRELAEQFGSPASTSRVSARAFSKHVASRGVLHEAMQRRWGAARRPAAETARGRGGGPRRPGAASTAAASKSAAGCH